MRCRFVLLIVMLALFFVSDAMAVAIRDVTFKTRDAGKVVFSHKAHMQQKAMTGDCKVCHETLFSFKKSVRFTMADMEKGKSCGACHNGTEAFPLTECAGCHQVKDITYRVKATGPTRFSHKQHLAASPDCRVCHPKLFAAGPNKRTSMAQMERGASCGACHNGKKASPLNNCSTCHPTKEITYQVKATGPTIFSHNSHLAVSRCDSCHPKLYTPSRNNKRSTMAAMEKGASCGACHNGKQAFAVKECLRCHPARELVFEEKSVGNVSFSHKSHASMFGCADCHPARYGTTRTTLKVSMKEMEKGKSCGACHDGKSAFGVQKQCDACHKM